MFMFELLTFDVMLPKNHKLHISQSSNDALRFSKQTLIFHMKQKSVYPEYLKLDSLGVISISGVHVSQL